MIWSFPLLAVLLLVTTVPATAAPSFDCSKASSDAEDMICADADLAALDQRLADTYQDALEAIAMLDVGKDDALSETRAMQRGWIKGRDDCWKAQDLRACIEAAYLTREGELVALWMLQEPSAVVAYFCEDNPANEVVVFYFDTALPSVRVEYGDGVGTGYAVPAASGAKYAITFGGTFWSKGEESLFAWTEDETMTCRQSPS